MLQKLRSTTGSLIAKVVLGLLVLSFAGWGIADYTTGGRGANVAAEVGDREIGIQQLSNEYRAFLQQQNLNQVDSDTAREARLAHTVLQQIVARALFDEEAEAQGLTASNRMVRAEIEQSQQFRSAIGAFDVQRFQQFLAFQGIPEAAYVDTVREDLAREQLIGAVIAGSAAPDALSDTLVSYFGERRSASVLRLDVTEAAANVAIPNPSDADLREFYESDKEVFRRPEMRDLTYVLISPEAVARTIEVSEEEVRQSYDARINEFTAQERRELQQMLFTDEAAANEAYDRLREGGAFAAVAEELSISDAAAIDLGFFARNEIPDATMAEKAFALEEGAVSEPFQGAFGWSIIKVNAVSEGSVTPFEEVRERIESDLALDIATDEVFERSKTLDDVLGEGGTLEDAGQAIEVPAQSLPPIDRQGNGVDGTRVEALPDGVTFLNVAFDTPEGEVSFPETTENNAIVVLRVNEVIESHIPDFAEVRDEVAEAWRDTARQDAVEDIAASLSDRLSGGGNAAEIAAEFGVEVETVEAFGRNGLGNDGKRMPASLADILFDLRVGEADFAFQDGTYTIARLDDIQSANTATGPEFRENIENGMASRMTRDLVEQFGAALQRRYAVDINDPVVDRVY